MRLFEKLFMQEILKREVHAVSPVMTRIGRHVYLLLVRVLAPQTTID